MRKLLLFLSVILLSSCSSNISAEKKLLEAENKKNQEALILLKDKIGDLEKTILTCEDQLMKFQSIITNENFIYSNTTINQAYIDSATDVYALPSTNSVMYHIIQPKTVVDVIFAAKNQDEEWVLVEFPIFESGQSQGWIKKSLLSNYTEEKKKEVISPIKIKADALGYEVYDFNDIDKTKTVKPQFTYPLFIEKYQEDYVLLNAGAGYTVWVKIDSIIYPEIKK